MGSDSSEEQVEFWSHHSAILPWYLIRHRIRLWHRPWQRRGLGITFLNLLTGPSKDEKSLLFENNSHIINNLFLQVYFPVSPLKLPTKLVTPSSFSLPILPVSWPVLIIGVILDGVEYATAVNFVSVSQTLNSYSRRQEFVKWGASKKGER